MAVRFQDILDAVEAVSSGHLGENSAWLCKQSGRIYWQFANDDEPEELPDDVDDGEKYIQIPDKRELDLGKPLALAFADEFLPEDFHKVRQIFSRRGAYGRFNDLLDYRRMRQQWFDYRDKAEMEAVRAWCAENSIEVVD
jgi:Uncharacterised protein family (UPF0158)